MTSEMLRKILPGGNSMSQKRKVYSPKLRSQVALAAVRGDKTIHEVAQAYSSSLLNQIDYDDSGEVIFWPNNDFFVKVRR